MSPFSRGNGRGWIRPRQQEGDGPDDLFRARLDQIINLRHELGQLADRLDWDWIVAKLADLYRDSDRLALPTRYMIGLLLLKQIYGLSDGAVCERYGQIKRELRRRSVIEAVIGHIKTDGQLDHSYLKGPLGTRANALLSAVGHNFRLILKWLRFVLRQLHKAIIDSLYGHN